MRRLARAVLALAVSVGAAAPATADDLTIDITVPGTVDGPFTVSDAQLRWGVNQETGGGAFFGGCNFLSAGEVGDTDGGRVWTEQDGFFRSTAGAVTIEKPYLSDGVVEYREMPFADRCLGPDGRPVSTSQVAGTGVHAVIDGGVGQVDPATGRATIAWRGSFTVVFYGGLTYWWVTDPVLRLEGGMGTLTATLGGFGSDRDDMSRWTELEPTEVVLADLSGVSLAGSLGFAALPAYRGVTAELPADAPAQVRTGEHWGAFPQSFLDFQQDTGQLAYWYSSGASRDAAKPATTLYVSYEADAPVPPGDEDDGGGGGGDDDPTPDNPPNPPPEPTAVPRPPAPRGVAPGVADAAGGETLPGAVMAQTVLPQQPGLIPAAPAADREHLLPLAIAGLLAATAAAVVAFRRGWLVLPRPDRGNSSRSRSPS